jgi:hypothetical protein
VTTSLHANPLCSILVPSCDAYSDLWRPFFTLFWRNWTDCPFTVYLGSNHKAFLHPKVEMIHADHGTNWTNRVREQLRSVPTPYVLLILEDFFFRRPVPTGDILRQLSTLVDLKGHALRLVRRPGPTRAVPRYPDVGLMTPGEPYRVSTQAAFWSKETLLALMREGESIWQFEIEGTKRSCAYTSGFYGVRKDLLPYGHHVVEKGKWFRKEAAWCKGADIGCDFTERPVMSLPQSVAWKCWKARSVVLNAIPWKQRLALKAVGGRLNPFLRGE